ncbi:MAG TPA: phosphate ABC transporter substrate-binding protein [Desulfitobacteriaceae bacterium]|nr:phosphate ABC transporter substrate-binding protein [Desulfitobacteriaceae bacterium]
MIRMKCQIALYCTALLLLLALAGCGLNNSSKTEPNGADSSQVVIDKRIISAAGATALQPLAKIAAEEFMNKYPEVQVNISGGGSLTGLNNVASGAIQIGNSDVPVTAELENKGLVDHLVCAAPFLIIVNKNITIDSLTKAQLSDIFSGRISNWKEVGGSDQRISIFGRAASSGTRLTIKNIIMDGAEFTNDAVAVDSTGNLLTGIAQTPGSIGYIDAAYLNDTVKALKYNGVAYSVEAVANGQYPIYTFEHMYTKGEAVGTVKAFIDYIQSAEFQNNFVEKAGFIPLSKVK